MYRVLKKIARSPAFLAAAFLIAGLLVRPCFDSAVSRMQCRVVKVSFKGPRNKAISGKIYYPPSLWNRRHPVILFCHGTLPDGKDTKFYQALMKSLSRKGYLIFGFDLRGFGKSAGISNLGHPSNLDFIADTKAAIDYMMKNLPVHRETVTIMGHSLGAAIAFAVGSTDDRIRNIIAISAGNFPPIEQYREIDKKDYLIKIQRATNLSIPLKDWDRLARSLALFQYLPLPDHKRVLIVLADCDSPAVINYNKRLYDELAVKKDLLIIPDSNHNFGFENFPGNEKIADPPLGMLSAGIESWLDAVSMEADNPLDPAGSPSPMQ